MISKPRIETSGVTDVGRRREHNEDAWTVFSTDRGDGAGSGQLICVVADGMGGHLAGEVASARAIETLERELAGGSGDTGNPALALGAALERANDAIWREARADPAKQGMGTTAVCALFDGPRAWLANVGDSPAYLVRGGLARQVSHDHSWVAEQVRTGGVRPEDAETHPYRHLLSRCLGTEQGVEVEVYEPLDLQDGDALVLCSDGLPEHVRIEEIGPVLTLAEGPSAAARALVDLANSRGAHDNITVVVALVRP